jgi:ribonuclease HI
MIRAFFDGSYNEALNRLGYAFTVYDRATCLHREAHLLDTNITKSGNLAEYLGFEELLKYLVRERLNEQVIRIHGDSQLVINQMFKQPPWQIHAGRYTDSARRCKALLQQFTHVTGTWIPREQNTETDQLTEACIHG